MSYYGNDITAWDGETLPEYFEDFLGQHIHPGDHIIYSTVSGHSSKLTLARVDSFVTHMADGTPYESSRTDYDAEPAVRMQYGREYKTYPTYKQPYFCPRVQPLIDSTSWGSRTEDKKTGLPKKVVLQVFDKIIKVPTEFASMTEIGEDV